MNLENSVSVSSAPNYDKFLDEEVRKIFRGNVAFTFEPLLLQLIIEIRKLNESLGKVK